MSKEFKTGIVAVIIIALFVWGYNFLKGEDLFEANSRHFFVEYKDVNGLNNSSLVTINGLKVGKVNNITFNSNPDKKGVLLVELTINTNLEFSKNSVAKIYSSSLMGGQNIAIIPKYNNVIALSGDYLQGEIELDIFSSVENKLDPIQSELKQVLFKTNSFLTKINEILDEKSSESLKNSILGFEKTISGFDNTLASVNSILEENKNNVQTTILKAKKISNDFSKVSNDLANANLGETIKQLQTTLTTVNVLMSNIQKGNGTLGKLITDDKIYTNLTKASKELEELLREVKLNPKRFVHFSLFGKSAKNFNKENNSKNIRNK